MSNEHCPWCGAGVKKTTNRKPWRGEWKCGSVRNGWKPYQMPQCRIVELENTVERLEAEIESLQGLLKDALAEPKNHEIAKLRADLAIWQDNSAELEECVTILKDTMTEMYEHCETCRGERDKTRRCARCQTILTLTALPPNGGVAMTQLRIPDIRTPCARATDPVTSHMAAEHMTKSGARGMQQYHVLRAIEQYRGHTAHELAEMALLDYYAIMRRVGELEVAGRIKRGEKRRCTVSGRTVLTWWPTK